MESTSSQQPQAGHHHHHHDHDHHHHRRHRSWYRRALKSIGLGFHGLANVLFPVLALSIVLLTLFYNNGEAWWIPVFMTFMGLVFACWGLSAWWCGGDHARLHFSPSLLLFGLPALFGVFQLIPSLPFIEKIAPSNAMFWRAYNEISVYPAARLTLSLAPDETIGRILLYVGCLVLLFLLTNCVQSPERLKVLLLSIVAGALGNAVYAYYVLFSSEDANFGNEVRGAFLNRNHFAFLMLMGTLAAIALASMITAESDRDHSGQDNPWTKLTAPLFLTVFVLIAAQLLSLSRGAFIGLTVSLVLFIVSWLIKSRRIHREKRQKALALSMLVLLALAHGLPFVMERLSERYQELSEHEITMDTRWLVWKDTVRLIKDHWQVGVGQGAYPATIQRYEGGNITQAYIDHSHNDFLEFTAENGLPLTLVVFTLALVLFFRAWRRIWKQHDPNKRWAGLGALCALAGMAVHETVEFNLLAWANLMIATALVAVVSICARKTPEHVLVELGKRRSRHGVSREERNRRHLGRYTYRLPLLIVSLAALCFMPVALGWIKASFAYTKLIQKLDRKRQAYRPGKFEFNERKRLLEQSEHPLINRQRYLRRKALVYATYAEKQPPEHFELLNEACQAITEACRRSPGDGRTTMIQARFMDIAKLFALTDMNDDRLIQLYQWAVSCSPTLVPALTEAGSAIFQKYLDSLGEDDIGITNRRREQARAILLDCIKYDPTNSATYDSLFYLYDDISELVNFVPKTYEAHSALMDLFFGQRRLDDVDRLAEQLLAEHHAGTHPLTNKQLLSIYSRQGATLELLGKHDRRALVWDKMLELYWSQADYSEVERLLEAGKPRQALHLLDELEVSTDIAPASVILYSKIFSMLGQQTDMALNLLRLTYNFKTTVAADYLRQALTMLGDPLTVPKDYFVPRAIFLHAALRIMLAEQTGELDDVSHAVKELEELEKPKEEGSLVWLQQHLVPLYEARGLLLLGKKDEAMSAVRDSLSICPDNLFALRLLNEHAPGQLSQEERKLLEAIESRPAPISILEGGLIWLALETSQAELSKPHETQELTYYFYCYRDIREHIDFTMTFHDETGMAYREPIIFKQNQELTLRVGEIVQIKHKGQPFVQTLDSSRRILADGPVVIKAAVEGAPQPYATAYRVRKEQSNK